MTDQPDPITRRGTAIRYRNPALVLDLLGLLEVHDTDGPLLVEKVKAKHEQAETTVTKTLADLVELGAIRSIYRWAQKRTDYRMTPLGRAWLLGHVTDPAIPEILFDIEGETLTASWGERGEQGHE